MRLNGVAVRDHADSGTLALARQIRRRQRGAALMARSAQMISPRHNWSRTCSSHEGAITSPGRDGSSPTGT